jgi:MerR family mercuric resistance operon transcriptional regulator
MTPATISGLARAGGVGVETIRYYQRRGLLETPERTSGGIRRYGAADLRRLRFIRSAQAAGFTLEEIGELIALDAANDRQRARVLARKRIAALETDIRKLQAARDALKQLERRCRANSRGPCPILSTFDGTINARTDCR